MRLFEIISKQELDHIQDRLNATLYMPQAAMRQGKNVIKLDLGSAEHMGGRAAGDRNDDQDYTADEVQDLLTRAKLDPTLDYQKWLDKEAPVWNGPGDHDPYGKGHKVNDENTGLTIPFVVKPNTQKTGELTPPIPSLVRTKTGIAPRNILKAKTIFRMPKGKVPRLTPPKPRIDTTKGYYGNIRRTPPKRPSGYDDGL